MLVKTDVVGVNKKVNKCPKRSGGPNTDFVDQKQTGRARSETKHAGVKKFSSFIWTVMVTKENGKMARGGWVNPTGPHLEEHMFCINTLGKRSENVG